MAHSGYRTVIVIHLERDWNGCSKGDHSGDPTLEKEADIRFQTERERERDNPPQPADSPYALLWRHVRVRVWDRAEFRSAERV